MSSTVAPTTPMTMRRAALYVKCIALLIIFYSGTLDFAVACRSLVTVITLMTPLLLAVGLSATPFAVKADEVLTLHAAEASAYLLPGPEGVSERALPSLQLALTAAFACPADAAADALTFSIADTHKRVDGAEIADATTFETVLNVPASQLAPVAIAGFCSGESAGDSPVMLLPGVATAQVSLRCRSESAISVYFASRALAVRLTCSGGEDQAPSSAR